MKNRKDAKRCLDVQGTNQLLIDLKPKRAYGELYLNQEMDVTKLVEYIKEQKKHHDITYFHAFSTIIGKVIYLRPLLNRFIANRHTYEHNDVTISYVMKIDLEDKAKELMVVIPLEKEDNIFTVSEKIKKKVDSIRNHKNSGEGANNIIDTLAHLPNIIRIPLIGILFM